MPRLLDHLAAADVRVERPPTDAVTRLEPGRRVFRNFPEQPTAVVGLHTSLTRDLYAFVEGWDDDQRVHVQVFIGRGSSIKTFINGVLAADFTDDMTKEGVIALQVHGIGKKTDAVGKEVMWRNIRIQELK